MSSREDKEEALLECLDRLAAVQIMGWIPVQGDWWPDAVNPGSWNCDVDAATSWAFEYQDGGIEMPNGKTYCSRRAYDWAPHSTIAHAFELVEAMHAHGYDIFKLRQIGPVWLSQFHSKLKVSRYHEIGESSAPLAITSSALAVFCGDAIAYTDWMEHCRRGTA